MKKTLGFCLVVAALSSSCKISEQTPPKNSNDNIAGMNVPAPRAMTISELDIGKRICSNLKKKREFFETLNNEKEQFRFKAELRNCDNDVYNHDLFIASISNANSTDLEYIAARNTYFKDVVTDLSGVLKDMCSALNTTDKVSNTAVSGNFKYSFNFLIADNYDRYEIYKSRKKTDGTFEPVSAEAVSVIGQKIQAPTKFFGVEKDRIRYTVCDGKRFSTMKQTWVEAITTF